MRNIIIFKICLKLSFTFLGACTQKNGLSEVLVLKLSSQETLDNTITFTIGGVVISSWENILSQDSISSKQRSLFEGKEEETIDAGWSCKLMADSNRIKGIGYFDFKELDQSLSVVYDTLGLSFSDEKDVVHFIHENLFKHYHLLSESNWRDFWNNCESGYVQNLKLALQLPDSVKVDKSLWARGLDVCQIEETIEASHSLKFVKSHQYFLTLPSCKHTKIEAYSFAVNKPYYLITFSEDKGRLRSQIVLLNESAHFNWLRL